MKAIDLLAESIIKIEEIKEEPVDNKENYCWNSIVILNPIMRYVMNEELEPPLAVFVQPVEDQGGACIEKTKDPLAACCEGASVATMKPETVPCSPVKLPALLPSRIRRSRRR
ncbi:Protein of unknown function [Gryllus bimaculatus]|nr:Protein of unknown function [Gryllus bimaculatus]